MMRIASGHTLNSNQAKTNDANPSDTDGFSDIQLMSMAAPGRVNKLLWDLSNARERRDLMNGLDQQGSIESGGGSDQASASRQSLNRLVNHSALHVRQENSSHAKSAKPKLPGVSSNRQSSLQKNSDAAASRSSGNGQDQHDLADINRQFQRRFSETAQDQTAFHELMSKTFGAEYDQAKAETIRQQTLKGDFSWMPEIKLVDGNQLNDSSGTQNGGVGLGAYSQAEDTVYLSRDLLTNDKAKAEKILTEEIGHALDARVNIQDAKGDEGDIFSRFMHGEEVSAQTLQMLQAEDDTGTVEIDGKTVEVEFGITGFIKKTVKKVSKAVKSAVDHTKKAVKSVVDHTKNAISSAVDHTKKAVSSAVDHVKKAVKSAAEHIKTGFQKLVQSKFFQGVLTVAQFIPGVGIYAKAINLAMSAYNVYQGVKNKSWGAVLGGVASIAGGVGKLGKTFGASSGFVNRVTQFAETTRTAAMAYKVIAQKDFSAAMGLAANSFGVDTKLVETVQKVDQVYRSAKQGDYLGTIGLGTSLLQDFTDTQSDQLLRTIGKNAQVVQQLRDAVSGGRYDTAAALLTGQYGGMVGLSGQQQVQIEQVAGVYQTMHEAKQLIQGHNYANAAELLLKSVNEHSVSPQLQRQLLGASQTLQQIDHTVTAIKAGRYSEGIATAGELLKHPLDEQSLSVLTDLQNYARDAQELKAMIKSGAPQDVINRIEERINERQVIFDALRLAA
ncbi:MAG: hypothetical protein ABW095_15195 [Candidatus Thiodiazotropha sp.]